MTMTIEERGSKMQRDYMMINPQDIVIDMPCSRPRIDELKASIQQVGMIQPITIWLSGQRVIDGFHRSMAAQELGLPEVPAIVVDCDAEAFWDARIQSAKQHTDIANERLMEWMYQSWKESDFGQSKTEEELYRFVYDHRLDDYMHGFPNLNPILTREDDDFSLWFKRKCEFWGVSWHTVAELLLQEGGIKSYVTYYNRLNIRQVYPDLPFDDVGKVTSAFQGSQEEVTKDEIVAFLASDMPTDANIVAKWRKKRKAAEHKEEQEARLAKSRLELKQLAEFDATEQGRAVKRSKSMERIADDIEFVLARMRFLVRWDDAFTLEEAVTENKRVKAQVDLLAAACTEFWNLAGDHLSGNALAIENAALRAENKRLVWKAEAYEREKEKAKATKHKTTLVLSSTDIEHLPQGSQA
jgi:hypothetical protein